MITRKAEYAISILVELGLRDDGKYVPSRCIAEARGVPVNLVGQIVSELVQAGWVEALRGPSGGVRLSCDPRNLSLREVIQLFDGPMVIKRCLVSEQECDRTNGCDLRHIWLEAQQRMLEVLDRATIWDLISTSRRVKRT